jgi:FkbM family methyltransferase
MIRNAERSEPSTVVLYEVHVAQSDDRVPVLTIPPERFGRYEHWSGFVPGGFVVDWIGTRTRVDVEDYLLSPQIAAAVSHDRTMQQALPLGEDLLLDWVPLLEAVELAPGAFTIVALGAGWGRWAVAGAFAARQCGKEYRIVAVEAEPTHFQWLLRHLCDNGIDRDRARTIHAAANAYSGTCMFQVGNPTGTYGQSIVSEDQLGDPQFREELQRSGIEPSVVQCVDLAEVLRGVDRVDYMHMDIQGAEADFLLAHPNLLDERVAMVNVGTHSAVIERKLRKHFSSRDWLPRYDIPMNESIVAVVGEQAHAIQFGDGVMVWENPRLTGRTEAPSFAVLPKG